MTTDLVEERLERLQLIRDSAMSVVPRESGPQRARAMRFKQPGFDRAKWKEMCSLGWSGLRVPEDKGGTGLDVAALCAVAQQLGASLSPEPFIGVAGAAQLLPGDWLPPVLAGERIVVPAHKLHPASDLTYDQLALVEMLGIGCHAVSRGQVDAKENVLIVGAGPIGLSVLEFVKLTGATIFVIEPNERRRDFVRRHYGIEKVFATLEPAEFGEHTQGRLAQVVLDATGNAGCMGRALEYAGFAGRVVFVGITTDPIALNDALFHRRELTLLATRNAVAADFTRILGMIREGQIRTDTWITHRAAFEEMPVAFPEWLKSDSGLVKALIGLG